MTVLAIVSAVLFSASPVIPLDRSPSDALRGDQTVGNAVAAATPPSTPSRPTPVDAPSPVQLGPEAPQEDIVVSARKRSAGDPLESVNVKSYAAVQAVDRAIIGPAALAYRKGLPQPVRSGLRNFLYNLHEPVVALNFMLQHKPGKAAETAGRFAVNSTVGAVGLFDVAKRRPFYLPRRPNGFANTMGFYGVKPGSYLFLPLIGPTTVRDFIGGGVDRLVLPFAGPELLSQPAYTIPMGAVGTLDRRTEFDDRLQAVRESGDPYLARRSLYLRLRQAEIDALRGKPSLPVVTSSSKDAPASAPRLPGSLSHVLTMQK